MKLKKIHIVIAFLFIAGIGVWQLKSRPNNYDYRIEAEVATARMLSVYLEEGLAGLMGVSNECYENEEVPAQVCFAHDVASKFWDRSVTAAMKLPAEDYFEDEQIIKRLLERDKENKLTPTDAAAYIQEMSEVVSKRLSIEWELQKYKIEK